MSFIVISDLHIIPIVTHIVISINLHQLTLWDRKVMGSGKEACTGSRINRISIIAIDFIWILVIVYLWLIVSFLDENPPLWAMRSVKLCSVTWLSRRKCVWETHVTVCHTYFEFAGSCALRGPTLKRWQAYTLHRHTKLFYLPCTHMSDVPRHPLVVPSDPDHPVVPVTPCRNRHWAR